MQVISTSDVTVFVVGNDPSLVAAVDRAFGDIVHVTFSSVPRSIDQLRDLAVLVAGDDSQLASDGVPIDALDPDPAEGTVDVTLQTPPSGETAATSDATANASSTAGYTSNAQAVLDARYGSGVLSVQPSTAVPGTVTDRYDDSPPFWGGDQIYNPTYGSGCSSGFAVIDPNGDDAVLSASHCGPLFSPMFISNHITGPNCQGCSENSQLGEVTWFWGPEQPGDCFYDYGKNPYYYNPPEYGCTDFETIQTQGASQGDVYGDSGTSNVGYPVVGDTEPAFGSQITTDGAVSGENRYLDVYGDWMCQDLNNPYLDQANLICGVGAVIQSNGSACQSGDSGGPAYQHGNTGVYAAGIIIGASTTQCWFQEMDAILMVAPGIHLLFR
jgi:hypothetical protein